MNKVLVYLKIEIRQSFIWTSFRALRYTNTGPEIPEIVHYEYSAGLDRTEKKSNRF